MADITMCVNTSCPSSSTCYRHEANPHPRWQSYETYKPADGEDRCSSYVEFERFTTQDAHDS